MEERKLFRCQGTLPLVQALLPCDIDKRVKWAEDYLEAAERDFTYPDYILWTDEAIFHLDGHVKRHNAVIWSVQNPHALMECSNQKKAGVIWADHRPYHWLLLHQWKCHRASVPSATTADGVASPANCHGGRGRIIHPYTPLT